MSDPLTPMQVIQVAHSLTQMQSAITSYELTNYNALTKDQRDNIEDALSVISESAGRLYAYSVIIQFQDVQSNLNDLSAATEKMKTYLEKIGNIQKIINVVSSVASLATSIMSNDIKGMAGDLKDLLGSVS